MHDFFSASTAKSFVAQRRGHKVNIFRCTPFESGHLTRMTHQELLEELDAIAGREGASADAGCELSMRDICKADPEFSSTVEPKVSLKGRAVLVNLGSQRLCAVLMNTEAVLLAKPASAGLALRVQEQLQELLQSNAGSFSADDKPSFILAALEAILLSATMVRAQRTSRSPLTHAHNPTPSILPAHVPALNATRWRSRRSHPVARQDIESKINELIDQIQSEVALVHDGASIFDNPSEGAAWMIGACELQKRVSGLATVTGGLNHALVEVLERRKNGRSK